jgi:hypothetical protein
MKRLIGISTLVVVIILLTGGAILLYRLAQFRTAVEQLQKSGQPISFVDLQSPEQNIDDLDRQAEQRLQRLMGPLETISETNLLELGVPQGMTIDPMTGDTMKVKGRTSGWVVYSVGTNLKDDGGDPSKQEDFVLGPAIQ